MVRQRRIDRAGRDNRVVAGTGGAQLAHSDLQQVAHLLLCQAVGKPGRNVGECLIGDCTGSCHQLDLAVVLDPSFALDDTHRGHQRRRELLRPTGVLLEADVRRLEPDGGSPRSAVAHMGQGGRRGAADQHLAHHSCVAHLPGRLVAVAAVRHECQPAGVD
ncbi:unannotated protein [freshwater metagenome]|uniref:Unannotated protein n=1 Tax=freshwater metagenome TaxID=449393 RepID=A0A6J7AU67_9ZZZZ